MVVIAGRCLPEGLVGPVQEGVRDWWMRKSELRREQEPWGGTRRSRRRGH